MEINELLGLSWPRPQHPSPSQPFGLALIRSQRHAWHGPGWRYSPLRALWSGFNVSKLYESGLCSSKVAEFGRMFSFFPLYGHAQAHVHHDNVSFPLVWTLSRSLIDLILLLLFFATCLHRHDTLFFYSSHSVFYSFSLLVR